MDQRHIGRRSAHVEGQEILETRLAGDPQRPGDAAGGTAHEQVDRHRLGAGRRGEAAVGAQQMELHAV